ncbi:cell division protein SepF [Bacillus marinisedimentorum]|uniref:cell division protein SepF n=1 Tax=Bacillus marinisedimentorum TaxID=1821260 RepID=UPI000872D3DB|nr:cell division protein SepF [Bacillus marinisedimentorum]
MSFKTKIKRFFELEDDYDEIQEHAEEEMEAPEEFPVSRKQQKQNVVSLQSIQKNSTTRMVLHEPRTYAEAQEIADHLKNRRSVIINLQRIDRGQAKRIVDFLSGTVYALGGDIQKLGDQAFLCTPDNVDVTGSITEMAAEQEMNDNRW